MNSLFPELNKPKPRRRLLKRLIDALRDAPEREAQGRQDRETSRKIIELEKALDRAIENDRP
jgi:hypothetical protein